MPDRDRKSKYGASIRKGRIYDGRAPPFTRLWRFYMVGLLLLAAVGIARILWLLST